MLKIKSNRKAGFTLMETLITVVILGIVAAILVPNLIKNQVENANRTKVKKAMASYEKAINYMIIENDIRETVSLRELGQNNCQYTREYFKTVKDGSNNCIFKTADRVWWDITDITNPIIILKEDLKDESLPNLQSRAKNISDSTVFAMVGRFDNVGTLRVNDNAYEQSNGTANQKSFVKKLWYFTTQSDSVLNEFDKCKIKNQSTCKIKVNGVDIEYEIASITDSYPYNNMCIYDRNSKEQVCNHTSTALTGDYYIKLYDAPTAQEAKSSDNCSSSITPSYPCNYQGDFWNVAKHKCEEQGSRLPTVAELRSLQSQDVLNGYFWAQEENNATNAYSVYTGGASGNYKSTTTLNKNYAYAKILCIGD